MDQNLILEHIKTKLTLVPHKPGCYQMLNNKNEIIYVGKAKDLHKRLRSYFSGTHDAKTTRMLMDVVTFEYIVATSEVEAFLLELNYINDIECRIYYIISLRVCHNNKNTEKIK